MAELVEFNLEQSLSFFNGLKTHVDDDVLTELVRKRRHHEYKICSLNRQYVNFESFAKHEMKVLFMVKNLQLKDGKILINHQINLLERLIRQILTHFKHDPKAFLFSIYVLKSVNRTRSELSCWEELLSQHGSKNVKFYINAVIRGMNSLQTAQGLNLHNINVQLKSIEDKLKSGQYLSSAKKMSSFEKEKAELLTEKSKSQSGTYISHMEWTRKVFLDGFNDFPTSKILLIGYLIFEIDNQEHFIQNGAEKSQENGIVHVINGVFVDYVLKRIMETHRNDGKYLREIVDIVRLKSSCFQSSEIVEEMKELIDNNNSDEDEEMAEQQGNGKSIAMSDEEFFDDFNRRFPDLGLVRVKNPRDIAPEFHRYLEIALGKFGGGALDKAAHYPLIRRAIEAVLMDFDWEAVALDLWWDYYRLARCCGQPLDCFDVRERAQKKLTVELRNRFELRVLKDEKAQK